MRKILFTIVMFLVVMCASSAKADSTKNKSTFEHNGSWKNMNNDNDLMYELAGKLMGYPMPIRIKSSRQSWKHIRIGQGKKMVMHTRVLIR